MADITKHSLGIASRSGKTIIIVPKGSSLPVQRSITVTTWQDNQHNIGLIVTLGERNEAEENFTLSRIKLDDIDYLPKGEVKVRLTFRGYTNGLWSVGVQYKQGGPEQQLSIIPSAGLTRSELEKVQEKAMRYIEENKPEGEVEPATTNIIPLDAI
jgi:molecular chaperone DnaK (HSP70)